MEAYYNLLLESPLFKALNVGELPQMLECLDARVRSFTSKQYIIHENDVTEDIGVVLEGKIQINNIDAMGNRSLTGKLGVGEVFGQVVAANLSATNPVSVVADTRLPNTFTKVSQISCPL
ncbi:MAG: cyclic nucleotide-binding domain-containing protein [Sphaerochaetaceae bacterium]